MKAYEALARALVDRGLGTMFGLMGDANMQYIAAYIRSCNGQFVGSVHESGAVTMADGYGRVSSRIGVAAVTHGPGLTNSVTALTESVRNRSQLLLLTGETHAGYDVSSQAIDIAAVVGPTGAGYERIYRSDTLTADFDRALKRIAVEKRPVVLNVPFDLLNVEVGDVAPRSRAQAEVLVPSVDPTAIDQALGVIVSAKRPVILAGRGAALANAHDDLVHLADIIGAPLATTLLGKDYFRGHPRDIGICGTVSSPLGGAAIAEADCIVAFGASLNKHTSGPTLAGKRIVHCDVDPVRIGMFTDVDVAVLGDARAAAQAMASSLDKAGFEISSDPELVERLAAASPLDEFEDRSDDGTVDPRTFMVRLDEMLPAGRTVVTDAGRFLLAPWRYLHVSDPCHFVHTTNFASIGLGLGMAIGASMARPDELTVAVTGDGGFMMHMAEFSTAVRYRLPIVVVVLNDGAYGAEYTALKHYGLDPELSLIEWPDFAPVAEALGGRGTTVRTLADLGGLAELIEDRTGPLLVDAKVNPAVDIWASVQL